METAESLIEQARAARASGNLAAAIEAQARAISLLGGGPRHRHALRHLADMLSDAGRCGEAEQCYATVLDAGEAPEDDPLDVANAWRGAAVNAARLRDREIAILRWREARQRYAALGPRLRAATGAVENPGVVEADAALAALDAH